MKDCFITFRSVTFAQRGEHELQRMGIHCNIQRTPRWMEEQGCGYSLRVPVREISRVIVLMSGEKLPYRKVYCSGTQGRWEEMSL